MPRSNRILTNEHPYHISARCVNREWFKIPLDQVWEIFTDCLYFANKAYDLQILAFVLMSNHFHLLGLTPNCNLPEIMCYLLSTTSKEIGRLAGRINQTYGGPHVASVIDSDQYLQYVHKYIYRNPVHAGIVEKVELYPYSTLNGLLGLSPIYIPVVEDVSLFRDVESTLNWLNRPYLAEDRLALKKAMVRTRFELPREKNSRRPYELKSF